MHRQRICGCENDELNIQADNTRQIVEFARSKSIVTEEIYIPIIFHICFEVAQQGDITQNFIIQKNIEYCVDLLNKDYQKKGSNFEHGKAKYKGTQFEKMYDDYVSLATPTLFRFYHKDTKHVPFPKQSGDIVQMNKDIKGASPVIDPRHNLNVWIVDINSGLLGFGQFSWVSKYLPDTDGIIIAKGAWGINPEYGPEFKLNKTLTHEVGHYLGLYHIFQQTFANQPGVIEGMGLEKTGDLISDTPYQLNSGYGDPSAKPLDWPVSIDTINGGKKSYHQWMNFMDYCDDEATFMFTKDQVYKMHVATQLWRPELLENENPNPVVDPPVVDPPVVNPPTDPPVVNPPVDPPVVNPPVDPPVGPPVVVPGPMPTIPPQIGYFVNKTIGFNKGWKLSGDASIKSNSFLKIKNKGNASISMELPPGNYMLTLNAHAKNTKSYITVDSLITKIPQSSNYQRISFEFRNKKNSVNFVVGVTNSDKACMFESMTIVSVL